MIIPPIYGIIDAYRKGYETRYLFCYFALLVIGIGSWLFHMTLTYRMQLMDEIPMVFGSAGLTYSIYQVRKPVGHSSPWVIAALTLYCALFVAVYLVINVPLFQEVIYGILVSVMMIMDLNLTIKQRSPANVRIFVIGMIMYNVGWGLWNFENIYCESVREFRTNSVPPGFGFLTQLHGWWHILAGYATYLQIVSVIHHRQVYLGKKAEYQPSYVVGLTVDVVDDDKGRKKL